MNQAIEIQTGQGIAYSDNAAAVYLASLSDGSKRTMREALGTIAGIFGGLPAEAFPWGELRIKHTQAIRAALIDKGFKHTTINKMLCALRGTLKAAWRLGQMTAEEYQQAVSIERVKGVTLPAGRNVAKGELAALMAVCEADRTPAGARDAAMIAVMYSTGMRRAEVTALSLPDYERDKGSLKVRGKGNKERLVWLVGGAREALNDWLAIRGSQEGALFLPIRRGGDIVYRYLSHDAVYVMLRKRAYEAGIKALSPHDLRRTFVGDLLDAGADIATVQSMAGHESVNTTARYDRRPDATKRKAAELLHVPYSGRFQSSFLDRVKEGEA